VTATANDGTFGAGIVGADAQRTMLIFAFGRHSDGVVNDKQILGKRHLCVWGAWIKRGPSARLKWFRDHSAALPT
jgi:hypothetical protein